MYFSARTEGIRTFRHALRAAYRTVILAAQILVVIVMLHNLSLHAILYDAVLHFGNKFDLI